MNSETGRALVIFIRNPEPGKVKTRLAASIGDELAYDIYRKLLRHTLDIVNNLRGAPQVSLHVFYSKFIPSDDLFEESYISKHLQNGDDLGQRMHHAFEQMFAEGYERIVIIGSDCAELQSYTLEQAFDLLESHDAVVGPARDGGYYLIGLRKPNGALFSDIEWSTDTVFLRTIKKIVDSGHTISILPVLSDVDTIEDLMATRADWLPGGRSNQGPENN